MKRIIGIALPAVVASALMFGPQPSMAAPVLATGWKIIAWNDLGMHCMDGDYGTFSILPPFNNVFVQVVRPDGTLLTTPGGVRVTYEGVADPGGSINTTSQGKTNFWSYAADLYGGSSVPDTGLAGHDMPGPANVPQPMVFDPAAKGFVALGVPVAPFDDGLHKRPYPMMRFVARDSAGAVLATTDQVLPVSDEMDCRVCHGSGSGPAAEPAAGWVFSPLAESDYRLNILRLHDERHLTDPTYQAALAQQGFSAAGLYDNVVSLGKPVLCASCHGTNALPGTGVAGISPFTQAVHASHAYVVDPTNGMILDSSDNRSACYRCHPGSVTGCLRGAMGAAVASNGDLAMQCQSCHGSMSVVGSSSREGWLEEPSCQSCHTGTATHNNGQIRYDTVFEPSGQERVAVNQTFATNPDVPSAGFDLYRYSFGHGDLACEACHGSTHAVYPAAHPNDNQLSLDLQGHVGTVVECNACHDNLADDETDGPHGMHVIGTGWVKEHHDVAEHGGLAQCRSCHGSDYRGTVLSRAHDDRNFATTYGPKNFWRGYTVGCYDCHDGPFKSDPPNNQAPTVASTSMVVGDLPVTITLGASDPNGQPLALRIVSQPSYGRVGLVGDQATYFPDPGFAGLDSFTFAAADPKVESNLGLVNVTRLANQGNYGQGYAGTGGSIPSFDASANPVQGQAIQLLGGNSWGSATAGLVVVSNEVASLQTPVGGVFLTEPQSLMPVAVPAAGLNLPATVPSKPQLLGISLYLQLIEYDPGAPFQFSFSPGLRLTLGS